MKGIIYKYTSPSNKVYIGQTLNEERRRKEFLNLKKQYGGLKINNARKKCSKTAFIIIIFRMFISKNAAVLDSFSNF